MCRSALLVLLGLSLELVNSFPSQEPEGAKHWVVIVAGSNGWYNYRHQVRGSVTKLLIQPVTMHHWPWSLWLFLQGWRMSRVPDCPQKWDPRWADCGYDVWRLGPKWNVSLLLCIMSSLLICVFKRTIYHRSFSNWQNLQTRRPEDWKVSRYEHTDVCMHGMCTSSVGINNTLRRAAETSHEELILVCICNISLSSMLPSWSWSKSGAAVLSSISNLKMYLAPQYLHLF